jgi:hypothetical protein
MDRPHSTQICFHLYRFQVIAELAESEYRRAALAAVRAALTSEQALNPALPMRSDRQMEASRHGNEPVRRQVGFGPPAIRLTAESEGEAR